MTAHTGTASMEQHEREAKMEESQEHVSPAGHDSDSPSEALLDLHGICALLGKLPPGALVFEDGLARMFGRKNREAVKRSIKRGELPPSIRTMGTPHWLAGVIVKHLEKRLATAAREAEQQRQRTEKLRP